jgi:hypothetical protein
MNTIVDRALKNALTNWSSMSRSESEDAESTANEFEASFYNFIDAVRDWVYGLEQRPQTVEELMELPMIQDIVDQLPAPLYLNFEIEAELIVENKRRIDEDKYD